MADFLVGQILHACRIFQRPALLALLYKTNLNNLFPARSSPRKEAEADTSQAQADTVWR